MIPSQLETRNLKLETGFPARESIKSAANFSCHIYGIAIKFIPMKQQSVRTTVDIPAPLYRKLKQQAAAQGRSVRQLVVAGVKSVLQENQRPRTRRLRLPVIVSKGPKVNVTNEQIYGNIEFP